MKMDLGSLFKNKEVETEEENPDLDIENEDQEVEDTQDEDTNTLDFTIEDQEVPTENTRKRLLPVYPASLAKQTLNFSQNMLEDAKVKPANSNIMSMLKNTLESRM